MQKKSNLSPRGRENGRRISGINLKRDIEIFRPEKCARNNSTKTAEEDFGNFYNELDKKRKSKKPFIVLMSVLLLVFFASLVYGLWSLKSSFQKNGIIADNNRKETFLTDQVSEGLAGTKAGDSVTIPVTEAELANFIGVGTSDFPIKKSSLTIKSDGIYISGRTGNSFLSFPVTIIAIPRADGGKLKIELTKASSGIVTLPLAMKNALNDYFENQVGTYTSDIGRIEVKEVVLKDHAMTLIGTAL